MSGLTRSCCGRAVSDMPFPPLLIINGADTRRFLSLIGETMSRCTPGSSLVVVPNATHDVANQNPTAFGEALMAFLSKN